ncbi:septum formation initiator family protein [Flagellimonas sp. DF-77]|uniref:FtsB family cell division protein n=1 Tax=Flagellimonas algarum TaxID=3230298 RepID=UPI0033908064
MGWSDFKKKKWVKVFANTYVLVLTIFVVWMAFFDTNSLLIHNELQNEINKLEQQKEFLKKEIQKDKAALEKLSSPEALEKYARERYYMKKDNEEVFLIEYEDSIPPKKDE